ncbi:hypothetical protein QCA50_006170 [Cerrena zonata]|uniref:Uncharacterized protein n=1 Tax=Cerrena zonata TaxID=2478898 RepID=A0AAW0GH31_9APHY
MSDDDLFLERLRTFYDKHLADLNAFASRENRSYEKVRLQVIEWHCSEVFSSQSPIPHESESRKIVTDTLRRTSDSLELLEKSAGFQSFFLVTNPKDSKDEGFLGGTLLGRDFWRNHRGCGSTGAQAFKLYCSKVIKIPVTTSPISQQMPYNTAQPPQTSGVTSSTSKSPANVVKAEVYTAFRNAIRLTSGQRNAEMKWTNHEKVSVYGVRIEGWPSHVPQKNPSALSAAQNKEILQGIQSGAIHFARLVAVTPVENTPSASSALPNQPIDTTDPEDFSWACKSHDSSSDENADDYLNDSIVSGSMHLDPTLSISTGDTTDHPPKRRRLDDSDSPNG